MVKNLIFITLCTLLFPSCMLIKTTRVGTVEQEHFKTELPFVFEKNQAIILPLRLGKEATAYPFHFDTHAPTTVVSGSAAANSSHLKFLGSTAIKLKTVAGEKFKNDVYLIDSIYVGSVLIKNISISKTPQNEARDTSTFAHYDGLLGVDALSMGVWKLDLQNNICTFASSIDSINDIEDKVLMAKANWLNTYYMNVTIDGKQKKLEVDFGTNSSITLAFKDFEALAGFSQAQNHTTKMVTAAGPSTIQLYSLDQYNIGIDHTDYTVKIASSKEDLRGLIGLGFFSRFQYVVIDYPNKKLYVSKALR